jgi:predicted membrane-bound spermidine synthase
MTTRIFGVSVPPLMLSIKEVVLLGSFFISGVAALFYQVCWNRALYGAVGVDSDSVSLIVSCFMLGVGVGGLFGGWLADKFSKHRIKIYICIEFGLAIFGFFSLELIETVAKTIALSGSLSLWVTAVLVFTTLLVPTILMGMTLPILSVAFEANSKNMGASVGLLYFSNTLGAAFGAYAVPFFIFPTLDLTQTVMIAACLNLVVAIAASYALKIKD